MTDASTPSSRGRRPFGRWQRADVPPSGAFDYAAGATVAMAAKALRISSVVTMALA
ncbi:hypothetical protein FHT76_007664 [Rhizobium sp. BK176]|nr:hypothetical protein [Rhizobium sp. BK181]MBB3545090.1 hypothetical protein [Rhizobium sp. BK399]MCS3743849.1 hypothetical protein [Rhizobium sp. BK661]MCS4095943.1 hypothetical protein [Rhizobium sp. BK176]